MRALLLCALLGGCSWEGTWEEPTPSLSRMLEQPRYDTYEESAFFANGQAMRVPPAGTVAFGALVEERAPRLGRALLITGQRRFETFCAPCHGVLADGRSVVAEDMALRPPRSLHDREIIENSDVGIFGVITNGFGLMPSYAARLRPHDRWAIVAYVRALQLSQRVRADSLPGDMRARLEER